MNCPKCNHERKPDDDMCIHCGIYFAKYEEWLKRQQENPKQRKGIKPVKSKTIEVTSEDRCHSEKALEFQQWISKEKNIGIALLMTGFMFPLVKHSMLAGQQAVIWPWDLAGLTNDPVKSMMLATYSEGGHPGIWTLIPLLTAAMALVFSRLVSVSILPLTYLFVGIVSLISVLTVFIEENERLGLIFYPPTTGAGIINTLVILACALIAASNHVSRIYPDAVVSARCAGVGGIMLMLLDLLFIIGGSDAWKAWSMLGLYGLVMIYAVGAAVRIAGNELDQESIARMSMMVRLLILWVVIAVIIAQNSDTKGFSVYVIQAGGGVMSTILAAMKTFAILYGQTLLIAIGMAGLLMKKIEE